MCTQVDIQCSSRHRLVSPFQRHHGFIQTRRVMRAGAIYCFPLCCETCRRSASWSLYERPHQHCLEQATFCDRKTSRNSSCLSRIGGNKQILRLRRRLLAMHNVEIVPSLSLYGMQESRCGKCALGLGLIPRQQLLDTRTTVRALACSYLPLLAILPCYSQEGKC